MDDFSSDEEIYFSASDEDMDTEENVTRKRKRSDTETQDIIMPETKRPNSETNEILNVCGREYDEYLWNCDCAVCLNQHASDNQ